MPPFDFRISAATPADVPTLQALRSALCRQQCGRPAGPNAVHCFDADFRIFLVHDAAGALVAFAEVAMRPRLCERLRHQPVAFLEGIYVVPAHRRHGIARALVESAAEWGRARGARELASDALLDNLASHAFHGGIGFEETGRVVYFRRPIGASS